MKGLPDIIGYHTISGAALYCEVKTASDKLSKEQIDFLNDASDCGCHCYIATESKDAHNKYPWPEGLVRISEGELRNGKEIPVKHGYVHIQSWADYRMINDAGGDT
jgi:hypothetical protein